MSLIGTKDKVKVYGQMRPPVAAADGNSPLRGTRAKQVFKLSTGGYNDRTGYQISKEQVI